MNDRNLDKPLDPHLAEELREQEKVDEAEYGVTSSIQRAIEELGLEWTCDLIEEITGRKVER